MSSRVELSSGFGSDLAAELEFSYGAGQTVNLLALRLQWFESTPAHGSYRAILQVLKPLGGHLRLFDSLTEEECPSSATLPFLRLGAHRFA